MAVTDLYRQAHTLTPDSLQQLGRVLVVAPHQDDESLGCGGTIALLRQLCIPVQVVFTTDGSLSHPNSKKYPAQSLIALREQEAIKALQILGVDAGDITFLRLPDGRLPSAGEPGFDEAADKVREVLQTTQPQTIILPWQRDPHADHRATWQMTTQAMQKTGEDYRRLEYLVWLWERAAESDLPLPGEVQVWQTDISNVIELKRRAIEAHISQTTGLIDDDPEGFTLSAGVLAHFDRKEELFVEKL